MLDQETIDCEKPLDRLVRTNQHFKVKMYHLKQKLQEETHLALQAKLYTSKTQRNNELKKCFGDNQLQQQLQTVDYSQPWGDERS